MKFLMTYFLASFLLLAESAELKIVQVGLASNFSEVSTGSSNPYGGYFKDGASLALSESKDKLKKKGIAIEFKEFDYGTSDIKVLEATRKAIASDVVAVLGYNYSSNALLASGLHHQGKLPMLTPSASATRLGSIGRYVHMGSFDNNFMGETLAQAARIDLKARQAVILPAANCAYCSDLSEAFEKEFVKLGGIVTAKIPILLDDKDFSSVVAKLKEISFDAILVPNQELTSARLISALVKAGFNKPYLGADGWGNVGQEFFAILKDTSFTGYSVSHWHPDVKTSASKTFIRSYQDKFKKMPNDTSVLAYDSMLLLVQGILNANTLSRDGIEDALNNMTNFQGVTGSFILAPNKAPQKSLILLKANNTKFALQKMIEPRKDRNKI